MNKIKVAVFFFYLIFSPLALAQQLIFKSHGKVVRTVSLAEMQRISSAQNVKVYDPNEKAEITFHAIPLKPLLQEILGPPWEKQEEVLFTCLDGYQPSIPVEQFLGAESFLAFERVGSEKLVVENKTEGGKKINAGPFYLVWKNLNLKSTPGKKTSEAQNIPDGASWPYQLATLDLTTFAEKFPKLAPPENASAKSKKGFLAFRKNCALCHSLNGEGAHIGPELNYPVNVTEYYKDGFLKKWIDNPSKVRFKTPMPALHADVKNREETIDQIIAYLKVMARRKIKPE